MAFAEDFLLNTDLSDATTTDEIQLKGSQGFYLQIVWTGGSAGDFTIAIQSSNDETTWTSEFINNGGTLELATTLSGTTGNHAVQFTDFIAPFMRCLITKGTITGGTLNGKISVVDNLDTH